MTEETECKSLFFTNLDGKPLCENCFSKPIVAENGEGKWWCFDCFLENDWLVDEYDVDESLIVCHNELESQSK